ncbi:1-aminocyclopropane-1-carboxylate deaminase/D-cysteine desulfhydrase [Endozoicomonas sp. 8E]|uniref:1-aminocyclopropane-1-carboxylate deaminase/D-cysteine desulfhydrase n=1 Tax=Endozoicomonas sp. 8E TaxID=3035692 RepID=UPI002938F27C|nr:pyridoxal-phosphate dependent enzyme [Endozoicomonas sp. 8E]WOG26090.1 pyridoxal-phosphate dependent enzyme [Endozoicomonas sp. 8E]
MCFSNVIGNRVPVERINTYFIRKYSIAVDILRLDQVDPLISGNKWFKLKYFLIEAHSRKIRTLLSFGGAWSNHLHAMAAAGYRFGFQTIGIIRGEKPAKSSAMLQDAERWGMRLIYVSRADYKKRYETEYQHALLKQLSLSLDQLMIVPEGGSGEQGVRGCEDILDAGSIQASEYDEIWLACGTGATMAGIIRSAGSDTRVRGVAVLRGAGFLKDDIQQYLSPTATRWNLELDYHCGGYGKTTPGLIQFILEFERETGVPLDPVYTGKLFFALKKMAQLGGLSGISRLLLIHTGGLQGRRGFREWAT